MLALSLPPPSAQEQRKTPRFDVDLPAAVTVEGAAHVGRIRNLSMGGALVCVPCGEPLTVGRRVDVSFALPELDAPLSATAEVRWVNEADQHTVGIQFTSGFRAKQTWALGRFFDRLRASQP